MAREKRALGLEFGSSPPAETPLEFITEGLVAPGIRILEREAAQLGRLAPRPQDPDLERFIGLFDPILVLANQRLRAGRAGDATAARELELLVEDLEEAQGEAARRSGLRECGLGFSRSVASAPASK